MSNKPQISVHEILSKEILDPDQDDITSRIYKDDQNFTTYIPQPRYRYVPRVTDPINPIGYQYKQNGAMYPNRAPQVTAYALPAHLSAPSARPAKPPGQKKKKSAPKYNRNPNEEICWTNQEKMISRDTLGVADHYFYFDSFLKEQTSDPNNGLYVYNLQRINYGFPIANIIEAIIGPMEVPNIVIDNNYQPNYFFFNRMFVEIENIGGLQNVTGEDKSQDYHFEFEAKDNSLDRVKMDPVAKKYTFTLPVRDLQEIRFRFKNGLEDIPFEEDCFDFLAVNPADAGPGGDRRIETLEPHNLTIGTTYAIYINDFNSVDYEFNNTINSKIGLLATAVTATKLELAAAVPGAVKMSTVLNALGGIPGGRVCIGLRRIAFQMRFRCLRPEITNFISP